MSFNPAAFLVHVGDLDMSEDRKLDLIQVVAAIMQSFVDRAFGDAPEQNLMGMECELPFAGSRERIESDGTLTPTFNYASHEALARKRLS